MGEKWDLHRLWYGLTWDLRRRRRNCFLCENTQKRKSLNEKIELTEGYSKEFIYLCSQQES